VCVCVSDMASWRDANRQISLSEDMTSDQTVTDSRPLSSAAVATATDDAQQQSYTMATSRPYPLFHGPLPTYMAMRPGVKLPHAMPALPFPMAHHMPMMPPNYTAMMMPHFVCISLSVFRLDALALSVIATATWVAGCPSQPVLYQND